MFAAAAMLAAATTLAASLPAWRAAWLDPMRVFARGVRLHSITLATLGTVEGAFRKLTQSSLS